VAEGEDEDVHRLDHVAHGGEMALAIGVHGLDAVEGLGLDARTEGIDDAAVLGAIPVVEHMPCTRCIHPGCAGRLPFAIVNC